MDLLLSANLPFRFFDRPEFLDVVHYLQKDAQVPRRTKMIKLINQRFAHVEQHHFQDWDHNSRISLSLDVWSSSNHLAFLAVVAYYLTKDWRYQSRLIGFIPLPRSHDGLNLGEAVYTLIRHLRIETKILAVTADGASNNRTLGRTLQKLLALLKVDWSDDTNLIPCMAHVLQLGVNALLQRLSANPVNDQTTQVYDENQAPIFQAGTTSIQNTLAKVCRFCFQF